MTITVSVDGNAIAGQLHEVFGVEVTNVEETCGACGRPCVLAEARVFLRAPAAVARCPTCGEVVVVIVDTGVCIIADVSGCQLPAPLTRGSNRVVHVR